MTVCGKCAAGEHHHDRYTATGADAGCPYSIGGNPAKGCTCTVVVHPTPPGPCPTCGRGTP